MTLLKELTKRTRKRSAELPERMSRKETAAAWLELRGLLSGDTTSPKQVDRVAALMDMLEISNDEIRVLVGAVRLHAKKSAELQKAEAVLKDDGSAAIRQELNEIGPKLAALNKRREELEELHAAAKQSWEAASFGVGGITQWIEDIESGFPRLFGKGDFPASPSKRVQNEAAHLGNQ